VGRGAEVDALMAVCAAGTAARLRRRGLGRLAASFVAGRREAVPQAAVGGSDEGRSAPFATSLGDVISDEAAAGAAMLAATSGLVAARHRLAGEGEGQAGVVEASQDVLDGLLLGATGPDNPTCVAIGPAATAVSEAAGLAAGVDWSSEEDD